MNYLSVDRIAKSFGDRVLFKDLSFGLSRGDKVALIAQNGTGKSSMLEIICGNEVADEGQVVMRNGVRVGYLRQEPLFDETFTISEVLEKSNSLFRNLLTEFENVSHNVDRLNNVEHEKALEEITTKMEVLQAWDY